VKSQANIVCQLSYDEFL